MVLNGSVAAVYVLLGSFRGLLSFKGRTIWFAYRIFLYRIVS